MPEPVSTTADRIFLGADFDGTIAQTFEPSPNGVGVEQAYEHAVQRVLGDDALSLYRELGGLRNRAPREVIEELTISPPPGATTQLTIEGQFPDVIPDDMKLERLVEDLVAEKLTHLTDEVGKKLPHGGHWPRPVPGFRAAWREITGMSPVDTAIISSGHTPFILKTLEMYGLEPPEVIISSDEVVAAESNIPQSERSKPNPFPMQMAVGRWYQLHGENPDNDLLLDPPEGRGLYVGDDPEKDGGLALATNMGFVRINYRIDDPLESGWDTTARKLEAM